MTLPRCIVPGRTVFVTRRCDDRRFLLRPEPQVNKVLLYCLAVYANEYKVQVSHFVALR